MKLLNKQWAVGRESRATTYFAVLFGTSVLTILAIRAFLAITNYPKLGGDGLHIAHMLWGGMFMLLSIMTLIYIHGHRAKILASFFGGVGFGFFIDELGKFITNDNDYFYKPTAMLIYIIFLLLWGLMEWLDNYTPHTPRQKFVDMLTRVRDGAINGISYDENTRIRLLLNDLKMSKKDQDLFLDYVNRYAPVYQPQSWIQQSNARLLKFSLLIRSLIKSKISNIMIYVVVAVSTILSFAVLVVALIDKKNIFDLYINTPVFIEIGLMLSVVITMYCVLIGVINTKINWQKTLIWYRRALLVNIFGTQVFLFYINQFSAVFGLVFSLLLLYVLKVMLEDYKK